MSLNPTGPCRSDCYIPLADESAADGELGRIVSRRGAFLLAKGTSSPLPNALIARRSAFIGVAAMQHRLPVAKGAMSKH